MISLTNIIKTDNKERLRPLRKWKDPKKHRLYQLLWVLIEDRLSRKMVLQTVENEKNEIICDQENIACKKGEDIKTFQRWKTTSMPWFRLIQKSGIHFFAKVPKWASSFYMWIYHMNVICCHWIWPKKNNWLKESFAKSTEQDVHFTQYHMCHPGKQHKSDFLRCLSLSSHHNKIIPLFDIFQICQENSKLPIFYIF